MHVGTWYGPVGAGSTVEGGGGGGKGAAAATVVVVVSGEDRVPRVFKTGSGIQEAYGGVGESVERVCGLGDGVHFVCATVGGRLVLYQFGRSGAVDVREVAHDFGFVGDGTGFERVYPPTPATVASGFNGNAISAMRAFRIRQDGAGEGVTAVGSSGRFAKRARPPTGVARFVTGSCDGFVRFWNVTPEHRIESAGEVPVDGIVTDLAINDTGDILVASVGREPRLGRWYTWGCVENRVVQWKLRHTSESESND